MTYQEHAKAVTSLALPLAGAQLAQFAVHMTDVLMMGRYGLNEAAALVLGSSYWFIIFIFLAGFAFAVTPLVANAVGSGDLAVVRRSTRMAMWISALTAVVVYPAFLFSEQVLVGLGQEPHIAAISAPYLIVIGIEMLPALVGLVLRSYFSALELAKITLTVSTGAVVVNIFLNWVLIFGNLGAPELGVVGAGLGSLIVSTLALIALVVYALRKTPQYDLFKNLAKPDWDMFRTIWRMGVPIGVTNLAEVGLFNAAQIMMGWISVVALAAHGFALQMAAVTFMIQIGLSQAATIRAGNAFGRGDELHLRRGALAVSILSLVMAGLAVIIFMSVPEFLISLFISPDEPQKDAVLATGASFLFFAAIFQFSDGGQVIALSLLRGLKDTTVPMWMATFSYWMVGLPVAYVCGFVLDWGGEGIWIGLLTGLTIAWVLMGWRFWSNKSKIGQTAQGQDAPDSA